MGYGPADNNRFGWCYRNEHGSGIRMTPYFETEKDVSDFHDYCEKHKDSLKNEVMDRLQTMMAEMDMNTGLDLRLAKLKDVNALAEKFAIESDCKVTISPIGETMREFYGIDQEAQVGYEDPSPYPWDEEE